MEDDLKKKEQMEDDLKKNGRRLPKIKWKTIANKKKKDEQNKKWKTTSKK
jgi:hypothetical protein